MSIKQQNIVYRAENGMSLVEIHQTIERYKAYEAMGIRASKGDRYQHEIRDLDSASEEARFFYVTQADGEPMAVLRYDPLALLPSQKFSILLNESFPRDVRNKLQREALKIFLQYSHDHQIALDFYPIERPNLFLSNGRWMELEELEPGMAVDNSVLIDSNTVSIPEGVHFKHNLKIINADNVRIGNNVAVADSLEINKPLFSRKHPDRQSESVIIGDGLKVGYSMEVEARTIRVGNRLNVGGDLCFKNEGRHSSRSEAVILGDDAQIERECRIAAKTFNSPKNLQIGEELKLEGVECFSWDQRIHGTWVAKAFYLGANRVLFPNGADSPFSLGIAAKALEVGRPISIPGWGAFNVEDPVAFNIDFIQCPRFGTFKLRFLGDQTIRSLDIDGKSCIEAPFINIVDKAIIRGLEEVKSDTLIIGNDVTWDVAHTTGRNIVIGKNVKANGRDEYNRVKFTLSGEQANLATGQKFQSDACIFGQGEDHYISIGSNSQLWLVRAYNLQLQNDVVIQNVEATGMRAGNKCSTPILKVGENGLQAGEGFQTTNMIVQKGDIALGSGAQIDSLRIIEASLNTGSNCRVDKLEFYGSTVALGPNSSVAFLITDEDVSSIPTCAIHNRGRMEISFGGERVPPHSFAYTPLACERATGNPGEHSHSNPPLPQRVGR